MHIASCNGDVSHVNQTTAMARRYTPRSTPGTGNVSTVGRVPKKKCPSEMEDGRPTPRLPVSENVIVATCRSGSDPNNVSFYKRRRRCTGVPRIEHPQRDVLDLAFVAMFLG